VPLARRRFAFAFSFQSASQALIIFGHLYERSTAAHVSYVFGDLADLLRPLAKHSDSGGVVWHGFLPLTLT
jgi:hypothetical protein